MFLGSGWVMMWPLQEWKKTWEDPAWLAVVAPESTEGRVAGAGGGAGLGLHFIQD